MVDIKELATYLNGLIENYLQILPEGAIITLDPKAIKAVQALLTSIKPIQECVRNTLQENWEDDEFMLNFLKDLPKSLGVWEKTVHIDFDDKDSTYWWDEIECSFKHFKDISSFKRNEAIEYIIYSLDQSIGLNEGKKALQPYVIDEAELDRAADELMLEFEFSEDFPKNQKVS